MKSIHTTLLMMILLIAGCGSPPRPNPAGYVPRDVRDIEDPVAAIDQRLQDAGSLLEAMASDGGEGDTGERVESLAREVAALMGHETFEDWPVTQARIRTRILFLVDEDADKRAAALQECRARFADLKTRMDRKGGRP